jgi:membrane protein EpsK
MTAPATGSRAFTILRNVAANWAGFAVNAIVTLLLTPIILHDLGAAQYGIWVLTSSVIGYYGLLDLGFRGGVTQYLTRYLAVGDIEKASRCISSAVFALAGMGVALALLSVVMAYLAPHIFQIPDDVKPAAFWCILIVGCASALQFAFFPFTAVFTAKQRFDLANYIGIGTRILTAIMVVVALKKGYGLIGVSAATCGVAVIDYLVRWRVARRIAPELRVARPLMSRAGLKEILTFGGWNFQISVSSYAEMHLQTIIISLMMPIAAAGYYALATGLVMQIGAVLGPIGQVIYPAAAELHARGEHRSLQRLFLDGTRLVLLAAIPVLLIACFWAEDFYRLWIGAEYVSGQTFPSVATLLRVLCLGLLVGYTANIAGQTLLGSGRIKLLALSLISGSALNLVLVTALVRPIGLLGVACASVAAAVLAHGILVPRALQTTVEFPVRRVLLTAAARPAAVAVVLSALFYVIRLTGPVTNWTTLFLHGAVAGILVAITVLAIGVSAAERRDYVWQPLRRLLGQSKAPV